jgi:hypothetical protein
VFRVLKGQVVILTLDTPPASAGTSVSFRQHENRVRREAEAQGTRLFKSRVRKPDMPGYGLYYHGYPGDVFDHWETLEAVEDELRFRRALLIDLAYHALQEADPDLNDPAKFKAFLNAANVFASAVHAYTAFAH